jgi:hypothetical protein
LKFAENSAFRVLVAGNRALLLSFVFGFVVRLIPEVLLSPYPIGFDPIWYAWRIKSGVVWGHWSQVFSTWLLYGFLVPVYNAVHVDLFGLLKVVAALLFGFNACGIFFFCRRALGWTVNASLFASVFFSVQAAALFFSANLYRNMLGMGVLLFALPLIRDDLKSARKFVLLALLSVLVVLSHETAAVVLFVVVFGFLVARFLKRSSVNVRRLLMAVGPALVIFLVGFGFVAMAIPGRAEPNVIDLDESSGGYSGALFFVRAYLAGEELASQQAVYLDLVSRVFSFFGVLYILVLPFVFVGFFRDVVLDVWVVLLLVGSFGVVVFPFFAPFIWSRWMLLLVFPFTFYAVNGIVKVFRKSREFVGSGVRSSVLARLRRVGVLLAIVVPVVCGLVVAAVALPAQVSVVPVGDFDDTVNALRWLDGQMDGESVVLVHFAFSWWSRLCLDESCWRVYFLEDVGGALGLARQMGFSSVFFVWWNEQPSWFSLVVPDGFVSVFVSGRVSVFEYVGVG